MTFRFNDRTTHYGKGDNARPVDAQLYELGYRLTFDKLAPEERKAVKAEWQRLKDLQQKGNA